MAVPLRAGRPLWGERRGNTTGSTVTSHHPPAARPPPLPLPLSPQVERGGMLRRETETEAERSLEASPLSPGLANVEL